MTLALGLLAVVLGLGPGQTTEPVAFNRPTLLPIDLVGVVVNKGTPEKSVCVLRTTGSTGTPIYAQPGDKVFQLAVIQAIATESILLKNLATEEIESLGFWKTRPPAIAPVAPSKPAPAPIEIPAAPEREVVVPKAVVDHYKANLKDFLDSASATPHFRDEGGRRVMDGFEIGGIKKGAIVDQLGFKVGDIILEVNGVRLDSLDKVMTLFQQAQSATRAELVVLRDGKRLTKSFSQK
jgi:type II secretory pathway component PulC